LYATEITSQTFEGVAFVIDLLGGADTESTKQADRRTPVLHRMLEEEARDGGGKQIPAPAARSVVAGMISGFI